jgi:hypothetical protein
MTAENIKHVTQRMPLGPGLGFKPYMRTGKGKTCHAIFLYWMQSMSLACLIFSRSS